MRDIETIDGELRLLARVWGVARHMTGRTPSTAHIDDLLDERAAAAGAKAVVGHSPASTTAAAKHNLARAANATP